MIGRSLGFTSPISGWRKGGRAALLLLAAVAQPLTAQQAPFGSTFDAAIRSMMTRWSVPGVVIVVVTPDRVLLSRGYGTRVVGESRTVDDRTLVHVASHSKAVTATTLAMLVDAGRLAWDDPVRRHIPEFAVADPYVTEHLTVRDLMSHRAGLPAGAVGGFRNSRYTADSLLRALRTHRTGSLFRDRQVYSQPGIALAGEIIARVSGMPWEQFVREQVFQPLGMRNSYTSNADLAERFGSPNADANIFIPARKQAGQVSPGRWSEIGTDRLYAPAGGIITTGSDVAIWIRTLLRRGQHDGGRLLSAEALGATWVPVIPPDATLAAYTQPVSDPAAATLGWLLASHAGHRIFFAPGGWMSSVVALMPDAQLGVGVFTNAYFSERHAFESLFYAFALAMHTLDTGLGLRPVDWAARFEQALSGAARR